VKASLLDLFCCAGGCSVGYDRAGFYVTGVDLTARSDYPFHLVVADALEVLSTPQVHLFDAIHASPPCQASTTMSNRYRGQGGPTDDHVNLIPAVREALEATGKPYVIENVCGARADMRAPITLTGGMFGLRVERPRLFETNWPLTAPPARKAVDPLGVYGKRQGPDGRRLWTRKDGSILRAPRTLTEAQEAMGIDWITEWDALTEAIPPAYTEWIGTQLLDHLQREAAA
jgi:DNA (cytosine-5)-methyltransferase 1